MRKLTIALLAILMALAFSATTSVVGEEAPKTSDIHLNLKEGSEFSPETKGDPEEEAVRQKPPRSWTSNGLVITREWKTIGTWTADNIQHDLSLGGPAKFNLWWVEDDTGTDARVQYRWTLEIGGSEAASYTDEDNGDEYQCNGPDPCEWTAQTSLDITEAMKEDTFSVTIEYWAFEDIYIYYDNATYDSGVAFKANALSFQKGASGGETYIEMTEAWTTNLQEALAGGFVTMNAGGTYLDNAEATVSNGDTYSINNGSVQAQKITWKGGGADASIRFSYTENASTYATPISVKLADIPGSSGSSSGDDGGLPGFELLLTVPAILFIASRRRR